MLTLNIQNNVVYFRDIKLKDLTKVLTWYNKVDEFKFATGIDHPITFEVLKQKYAEVLISENEFFVGIYTCKEEEMIGILKGNLKLEAGNIMWISSIVIDPAFQNMGYGTETVNLLINYVKLNNKINEVYLAVIEDNLQGRTFWLKQDFQVLRKISNHIKLQDKSQNVIIMFKNI
jgi:RimJ/RimL family protein N-acetyltransferase